MLEETVQGTASMGPQNECVVYIAVPEGGFLVNGPGLEKLHIEVCNDWEEWGTHWSTFYLFEEVFFVGKVGGGHA